MSAIPEQHAPHSDLPPGISLLRAPKGRQAETLSYDALAFLAHLHRTFNAQRLRLLAKRQLVQAQLDIGWLPDFALETADIRASAWQIAGIPKDLQDRRVEITGPVDRKMVINALNSGANCFMADFEDASSPTWDNQVDGQANLYDAVRRQIDYTDPTSGKQYTLNEKPAVLLVRPRGWHLDEAHMLVDGEPISGSLFDFGLYFFHNVKECMARGTGAYFYLPKLEHHTEAQLWNDVFVAAQQALGIPVGTIKATVLIETILATFQAEEILHALQQHIVALNCGRWDYIFSYIKKFRNDPSRLLPDRAQVTMTVPCMRAYTQFIIHVCHKRGAMAMGGMAAQIPIKNDAAANDAAMAKVKADKDREAGDGHDGTWVAHPALVPIARAAFDAVLTGANQLDKKLPGYSVTAEQLLAPPQGTITEMGLRHNIQVGIGYLAAWLQGQGCVPLNNLMEDAATAEICRAQCWQWLRHGAKLDDGRVVTSSLFHDLFNEEMAVLAPAYAQKRDIFTKACDVFKQLCLDADFKEFLTLPAYGVLVKEA